MIVYLLLCLFACCPTQTYSGIVPNASGNDPKFISLPTSQGSGGDVIIEVGLSVFHDCDPLKSWI